MNTAYVALGANIGDPTATVLAAFAAVAAVNVLLIFIAIRLRKVRRRAGEGDVK